MSTSNFNNYWLTGLTISSNINSINSNLINTSVTIPSIISSNYNNWCYDTDNKTYEPLKDLYYTVFFEIDNKDVVLTKNIYAIRKKKFIFNCAIKNNRIQPYEYIMSLIEKKKEFNVTIKVSDIITITYSNFRFTEIVNNLNFGDKCCDFSKLHVKFKCDKILYENHKLSTKQLRTDKIKKIENNQI